VPTSLLTGILLPCWEDKLHKKKFSLTIRRLKMVTIRISRWATESGREVGKRSLEMKPLPDFVQMIDP
jgi:hypothetical protein